MMWYFVVMSLSIPALECNDVVQPEVIRDEPVAGMSKPQVI